MRNHTITVFHDDGLYRHIRMSNGNSWNDRFDLVTWPGYLSYSGDLGDYTFQRLEDMFTFFRGHDEPNPDYWSSKLQSVDKHSGYYEFSNEKFRSYVIEDFRNWDFDNPAEREISWQDLNYELVDNSFANEVDAKSALDHYKSPYGDHSFVDAWEADLTDYTYMFVLACYGIPWAISKYDEYKTNLNA